MIVALLLCFVAHGHGFSLSHSHIGTSGSRDLRLPLRRIDHRQTKTRRWMERANPIDIDAVPEQVRELKQQLLDLGSTTRRGFRANRSDRTRARDIIYSLASYCTVSEPTRAYYAGKDARLASSSPSASPNDNDNSNDSAPTLRGQWTLIYTDAPDITSLGNTNPWAVLGRIGQDCRNPPLIQNVIEWKRPSWAANLPLAGTDDSRILQKVVTRGSAQPSQPTVVDLAVAGLSIESSSSMNDISDSSNGNRNVVESIRTNGLVAGLLQNRPVDLSGPWNPPFGSFEVLYLDDDFRVTRTNQNYFAANTRVPPGDEWF